MARHGGDPSAMLKLMEGRDKPATFVDPICFSSGTQSAASNLLPDGSVNLNISLDGGIATAEKEEFFEEHFSNRSHRAFASKA